MQFQRYSAFIAGSLVSSDFGELVSGVGFFGSSSAELLSAGSLLVSLAPEDSSGHNFLDLLFFSVSDFSSLPFFLLGFFSAGSFFRRSSFCCFNFFSSIGRAGWPATVGSIAALSIGRPKAISANACGFCSLYLNAIGD